jgi:hypothetical protein
MKLVAYFWNVRLQVYRIVVENSVEHVATLEAKPGTATEVHLLWNSKLDGSSHFNLMWPDDEPTRNEAVYAAGSTREHHPHRPAATPSERQRKQRSAQPLMHARSRPQINESRVWLQFTLTQWMRKTWNPSPFPTSSQTLVKIPSMRNLVSCSSRVLP